MKVAIYVRVSTTEQAIEGYSIPAQINILRHYCNSYQYEIYNIYQDQGISGKNIKDRPGLLELLEDAQERKFDIALVWKLSRLSRSLLDLLSAVDILEKNNISFQSYTEKFDTATPSGKMLLQLLGSIAEFERNTIVENVKLGMAERFKNGLSKGTIPYGYMYKGKEVLTVPAQAQAIKFMFEYYNNSDSPRATMDIVDWLNGNGYKTKQGNFWTRDSVIEVLKNKFYAGYVRTGLLSHKRPGENYSEAIGVHEPIIDLELYNSVNQKIQDKKRNPHMANPENDCILSGLIVCPVCNKRLFGNKTHTTYINASGEKQIYYNRYYRCRPNAKNTIGKCIIIPADKIEDQVLNKVFTLSKSDIKKAVSVALQKHKKSNKPIVDKVKSIDAELVEAIKVRDRYYKILDTGALNEISISQFTEKINEIMNRIDYLEKQRDQEIANKSNPVSIIDTNKFIENIKEVKSLFNDFTNEQKKRWLRGFIKEIQVDTTKELKAIVTIDGINFL